MRIQKVPVFVFVDVLDGYNEYSYQDVQTYALCFWGYRHIRKA
ncbi:hypothetical protein D1BOALGB6SA_6738 [Olavius sp. associated proteobacterium Delta 1]|nr:hypothetical protein D1BOALGB6SA_6738 [Olavius sp. associated proteobacterium Delta 1]